MELTGRFERGWVPDLLHSVMASGNTSVMEIACGRACARLGFVGGELVRIARVDRELSREALLADAGLAPDTDRAIAEECVREQALWSLLDLFDWESGDFKLDPMADPTAQWQGPEGLVLYPPIAGDFLQLEIARRADEQALRGDARQTEAAPAASPEPSPPEAAAPSLEAVMVAGSVPELLRAVMVSGNTAALDLMYGTVTARLGFVSGELVHLASSELPGSRAERLADAGLDENAAPAVADECLREQALWCLLDLFDWDGGRFILDPLANAEALARESAGLEIRPPIRHEVLELEIARRTGERLRREATRAEAAPPHAPLLGKLGPGQVAELVRTVMASGNDARLGLVCGERNARLRFASGELACVVRSDRELTRDRLLHDAGLSPQAEPVAVSSCIREKVLAATLELFEWGDVEFVLDPLGGAEAIRDGLSIEPPIALRLLDLELERRRDPRLESAAEAAAAPPLASPRANEPPCAVVAIGPDVEVLEQLKTQLRSRIGPIHLVQLPEQGLRTVGHYIARGGVPLVIVDASAHSWPLSLGPQDVIERVIAMSPHVRIALVTNDPAETAGRDVAVLSPPLSNPGPRAALTALIETVAQVAS